MEIYKQIRKMRLQGMSQRQIATSLHISRNTVKKYWDGASVPWKRKNYSREASVLTEHVVAFVRHCLEEDTHSPKKQHHTAKRIMYNLAAHHAPEVALLIHQAGLICCIFRHTARIWIQLKNYGHRSRLTCASAEL